MCNQKRQLKHSPPSNYLFNKEMPPASVHFACCVRMCMWMCVCLLKVRTHFAFTFALLCSCARQIKFVLRILHIFCSGHFNLVVMCSLFSVLQYTILYTHTTHVQMFGQNMSASGNAFSLSFSSRTFMCNKFSICQTYVVLR